MAQNFRDYTAQSVSTLKAEARMPSQGAQILNDPALSQLHRDRAATMLKAAEGLSARGVRFSAFLEIGAGSAQRSTALLNTYGGNGVASDINQGSLSNNVHIKLLLGYERVPLLISCDAAHLPFLNDTFEFVFAYQMLHRFNDPSPVVAEAYRVLAAGGHFYFDEEPTTSGLRELLRQGRQLTEPPSPMQRIGRRLGLAHVFWDDGAEDRSRWGVQVMRFTLETWRHSLEPFLSQVDLEINGTLKLHTNLERGRVMTGLAGLVGGRTTGLCQKLTGTSPGGSPAERLMCVDCHSHMPVATPQLELRCPACDRLYPRFGTVFRLLPRDLEDEMYGRPQ
jgi:SAM-dependent methyltransferase